MEPDRTNFVIIGRIRTGTSQICSGLDSHPNICCKLELLKRGRFTQGVDKVESYLAENIYGPAISEPIRGFKIMYHQFWGRDTPEFYWICDVLKEFDVKVMHVHRRNFLDHFLSIRLARECNIWNAWVDRQIDEHFVMLEDDTLEKYNQPIEISVDAYQRKFKSQGKWSQAIDDMFPNRLIVDYETIDFAAIQRWLGATEETLTPATVRMRVKPKRELISNYDEVAEMLHELGHEWMLEE